MSTRTKSKLSGHAAHTQDTATQGLPGVLQRPIKLTMLGAGSGFTPRLVNDVLRIPGNQGGVIALVDIDLGRLRTMHQLIRRIVANLGLEKCWKVVASPDRTQVLAGSDYVVSCIEVSGLECVRHDNDIPLKYGVDQCIGDTIGPGGLFKSLRTIPVFLAVLRDCERFCPQALVLNYTNPMAMMCTAAGRSSSMPVVGLCHSVQGTSHLLADYAGVPYAEMDWECAGINHLAWFTTLKHRGVDLYAKTLREKFTADLAEAERERERAAGLTCFDSADIKPWVAADKAKMRYKQGDLVRKDMCLHFGAFITESSGHLSEYLPYYRKSAAGQALLRQGYDGGTRFYATNWPEWRKSADASRLAMLKGTESTDWPRSWEYASWIIEAREKDVPFRIHGNVMNSTGGAGQLITNLPADSCVEVSCLVDGNGVQPTRYGALPRQMANVCATNLGMFDLGAQAVIERSKEAAIHALMLDPLTSAVCTPAQIKAMTLELFAAEREYLPEYR
jgi:alpha-galactosidase